MEMEFRRALPGDLPAMLDIVAQGKAFLRRQGVDQWQMGDPSAAGLTADIENGDGYVLVAGGEMLATLAVVFAPDPSYETLLEGSWGNDEPYAAMHRVVVGESARGKGVAPALIAQVEALCQKAGVFTLRIDTHPDNKSMQGLLLKSGFIRRGRLILKTGAEAGRERVAFDKQLG